HQRVTAARKNAMTILADAPKEIVSGAVGVHFGIDESDEVTQEMIAENHSEGVALLPPAIGPVETVHTDGAAQAPVQYAAVGSRPFETGLGGNGERLIGNRPFRWPQSHWGDTELARDVIARHLQLPASVRRVAKTGRKRHVGMR